MEQEKAVKRMMLDIKVENIIPPQCYPFIRKRLELMWLVGYEAQIRSYPQPKKRKPVRVMDKQGEAIGDFDCTASAADFLGVTYISVNSAIRRGGLLKEQYYIRYL